MTGRCVELGMSPSRHGWCLDRRSRSLTGLELRPRPSHLALFVVAFVVAGLGLLSSPASAHSGKQSYLYLSIFDDGVEGRVEIPAVDLGPAIGVDLVGFPGGLAAGVAAERSAIVSTRSHRGIPSCVPSTALTWRSSRPCSIS